MICSLCRFALKSTLTVDFQAEKSDILQYQNERTVLKMKIRYNRIGSGRKALVRAIEEITECTAQYLGAPTFAYQVDYFTIEKDGTLEFDDRADSEKIENLLEQLAERGFEGTAAETPNTAAEMPHTVAETEAEELSAETETARHSESLGLTVAIPMDSTAVGNLKKLLEAKGNLIKKAFGIDSLPIEVKEETVEFPWFETVSPEETAAYTHFISALCELSKNAKRVTAKEKEVDNEKYAFRCFLLRLGFIGTEYKAERKILLRNLSGSAAFKTVKDGEQE